MIAVRGTCNPRIVVLETGIDLNRSLSTVAIAHAEFEIVPTASRFRDQGGFYGIIPVAVVNEHGSVDFQPRFVVDTFDEVVRFCRIQIHLAVINVRLIVGPISTCI